MGNIDPIEDLSEYLSEEHGIQIVNEANFEVQDDIRNSLSEYWQQIHKKRRGGQGHYDMTIDRLVRHDVNSCLTVLGERQAAKRSETIGFPSWWFTIDKAASRMPNAPELVEYKEILKSLVMSTDFLIRYIAFGPGRDRISTTEKSQLRVFAPPLMEVVPKELIEIAMRIRSSNSLDPERKIKRRLRDAFDLERSRLGALHDAGLEGLRDAMSATY